MKYHVTYKHRQVVTMVATVEANSPEEAVAAVHTGDIIDENETNTEGEEIFDESAVLAPAEEEGLPLGDEGEEVDASYTVVDDDDAFEDVDDDDDDDDDDDCDDEGCF